MDSGSQEGSPSDRSMLTRRWWVGCQRVCSLGSTVAVVRFLIVGRVETVRQKIDAGIVGRDEQDQTTLDFLRSKVQRSVSKIFPDFRAVLQKVEARSWSNCLNFNRHMPVLICP